MLRAAYAATCYISICCSLLLLRRRARGAQAARGVTIPFGSAAIAVPLCQRSNVYLGAYAIAAARNCCGNIFSSAPQQRRMNEQYRMRWRAGMCAFDGSSSAALLSSGVAKYSAAAALTPSSGVAGWYRRNKRAATGMTRAAGVPIASSCSGRKCLTLTAGGRKNSLLYAFARVALARFAASLWHQLLPRNAATQRSCRTPANKCCADADAGALRQ